MIGSIMDVRIAPVIASPIMVFSSLTYGTNTPGVSCMKILGLELILISVDIPRVTPARPPVFAAFVAI